MQILTYSARCVSEPRRKVALRRWVLTGLLTAAMTPGLPGTFSPLKCIPKITPAYAATRIEDDEKVEAAEKSRLFTLVLPAGAMRSKDEADIAKFAGVLQKMAKAGKCEAGEVEVLVWMNNKEVKTALSRALKNAGAGDTTPLNFQVDASAFCLNVMGRKMPAMPDMPKVAAKPGFVRGYVRDTQGHPLKGALIGVRSTAVGGFYSGASAKTDAQGYYEIKAPWGVGSFYCAGYATDYGDLIAAFGLHPTDGETDQFATATGVVKNWVLLPYGVGDRAKAQDDPKYCGNYYGGSLVFSYYVEDGSQSKSALPANSQVEITLTPDGPLLDGSKGHPIIVRKATGSGFSGTFYLNNIPVGVYKIKAQVQGIGALRLRETGPYSNRPFGMTPKDTVGEANLLLKVYDADPNMATASHGHWNTCQISLERP